MYRRIIEFDGVLGWLLIDIAKKKFYLLRYWSGFYVIRYIVGNCNRQKYFQFCVFTLNCISQPIYCGYLTNLRNLLLHRGKSVCTVKSVF